MINIYKFKNLILEPAVYFGSVLTNGTSPNGGFAQICQALPILLGRNLSNAVE